MIAELPIMGPDSRSDSLDGPPMSWTDSRIWNSSVLSQSNRPAVCKESTATMTTTTITTTTTIAGQWREAAPLPPGPASDIEGLPGYWPAGRGRLSAGAALRE